MLLIRSQFPFFLFFLFSFSVFSCEDKPLYIEDKDLSLKIDTVSFVVTESITYQTPPIMGGSKRLYLGRSENYDFEYAMIRFNNTASRRFDPQGNRNIIDNFIDYNDSLLTIDSLGLKLFFSTDSVQTNSSFKLHYYPDGADSVFSQTQTNYYNHNANFSNVISYGNVQSDTSSLSTLNFKIDSSYFSEFMDTSNVSFNNTFLISISSDENKIHEFLSVNEDGINFPSLSIYFTYQIDDSTLIDTFNTHSASEDLSILKPPALSDTDSTHLSVSLSKGLKSLLTIDMKDWKLPKSSVIRKAELLLFPLNSDSTNTFIVNSYPTETNFIPKSFTSYTSDPFIYNLDFGTSTILTEKVKFNHRLGINGFFNDNESIHVFNLQSSSLNDPFKTVSFYDDKNVEFYPRLRILYVNP